MGERLRMAEWIHEARGGIASLADVLDRAERPAAHSPGQRFLARTVDRVRHLLDHMAEAAADTDLLACPRQAIHGDFSDGNLGYDDADRLCALYDFDDAALDLRGADVANALSRKCRRIHGGMDVEAAGRMLRRYQRSFPLAAAELKHLPTLAAAKEVWYLIPHLIKQTADPDADRQGAIQWRLGDGLWHLAAHRLWQRVVEAV